METRVKLLEQQIRDQNKALISLTQKHNEFVKYVKGFFEFNDKRLDLTDVTIKKIFGLMDVVSEDLGVLEESLEKKEA